MSTQATLITAKHPAGQPDYHLATYLHHDGYPSHAGRILHDHYQDPAWVDELISLGDLSSLYEKLEPTKPGHSYATPEPGVCVAYGRDRGETGVDAIQCPALDVAADVHGNYHAYYFDGNQWHHRRKGEDWQPLSEVLANL